MLGAAFLGLPRTDAGALDTPPAMPDLAALEALFAAQGTPPDVFSLL
jgi:hypothetical protein